MEDEKFLVKHTAAVHISNILTLNQRKIANVLLKNAYQELISREQHSIKTRDLLRQLGWSDSSSSNDALKKDLKVLNTTQLEWNIFKRDRRRSWNISTMLAGASIENGVITYSYSTVLRQALYNPNIYAKLDLGIQRKIQNKHAIAIWEYVMCELSIIGKRQMVSRWIPLDDIRKLLGLQDKSSYNSFKAFHRVLETAVEEINAKSEIKIETEFQKEKREVKDLRFVVSRYEPQIFTKDHAKAAKMFGLAEEQIKKDLADYGKDRVDSAIKYTSRQIINGKIINNVAAFYKMALRENWKEEVTSENVKAAQIELAIDGMPISDKIKDFLSALKEKIGAGVFNSWFSDAQYEVSEDDNTSSPFKRDYILNNFSDFISATMKKFPKITGISVR